MTGLFNSGMSALPVSLFIKKLFELFPPYFYLSTVFVMAIISSKSLMYKHPLRKGMRGPVDVFLYEALHYC